MFELIKKNLSLAPKDLKDSFSGNYFLSIELSLDGLSYCLLDTESFQYQVLESFSFTKVQSYSDLSVVADFIMKTTPVPHISIQKSNLVFLNSASCLVADSLFDPNQLDAYFNFHFPLKDNHIVKADKLNNLSAYNVYALPVEIEKALTQLFPNIRIRHYSSTLIENLCYYHKAEQITQNVVLHVQDKHFEILIFDGSRLVLYNTFPYATWEDLLYYMLYVLEQLEIAPEKSDVLILGEIAMDSNSFQNVRSFMRSVDFGQRTDFFKYHWVFDELPPHYYFNLLNVNACG